MKKRYKIGFTLIELMIIVAVVGILSAIMVPKFSDMIIKSRESTVKGELGTMRSAVNVYYADNQGIYPSNFVVALTTERKYLSELSNLAIPAVTTVGNPGHQEDPSGTAGVQQGAAMGAEPVNFSWFYFDSGQSMGSLYVLCLHDDSKGSRWSTY